MAAPTERNWLRLRAIRISRAVKDLFLVAPGRMWRGWLLGWLWRAMFIGDDGRVHRGGEMLLADLREFAFAGGRTVFSSDPLVMARREGRREVFMRIINYLNLDEAVVQKLMEVDDGLE